MIIFFCGFTSSKGAFARAFLVKTNFTETMANYLRAHIGTKSAKETMSKNLC